MPVRLFVGNLPYDATEEDIRAHFSTAGTVLNVFVPLDRETGRKRGFAFVEYNDNAQAQEAIRLFNSQPFKGRRSLSTKPEQRKPGHRLQEAGVASGPVLALDRLPAAASVLQAQAVRLPGTSSGRILLWNAPISTPGSLGLMPNLSKTAIRRLSARKVAKKRSRRE